MAFPLNSGIYNGHIRHRRFTPVNHQFHYSMFMMYIDLDELEQLTQDTVGFGTKWYHFARFRRQDYIVGAPDLRQAAQDKLFELTGHRIQGSVRMLCHLRYAGLYFSPLNLYYLFDEHQQWQYVIAEVSNTPWLERHYYAIPARQYQQGKYFIDDKDFHVSPFNPMQQDYIWRLSPPESNITVNLETHTQIDCISTRGIKSKNQKSYHYDDQTIKVFDATLILKKQLFTSKKLLKNLVITPIMTIKVVLGIYWQAAKLWFKGAPVYNHPNKS